MGKERLQGLQEEESHPTREQDPRGPILHQPQAVTANSEGDRKEPGTLRGSGGLGGKGTMCFHIQYRPVWPRNNCVFWVVLNWRRECSYKGKQKETTFPKQPPCPVLWLWEVGEALICSVA